MADNATLKTHYLAQVETDLEHNGKERDRVTTEIAALQDQLASLEQDHALLVGVRQSLVGAAPQAEQVTARTEAPADTAPVRVPRARKPKAAARTPKRSAPKKAVAAPKPAKAAKPAKVAKPASTGGSAKGSTATAPTLVELVTAALTGHSEPRSAAEVGTALTQEHPKRKIQTTVVRNTLEALVAKGQALRSKQGRSVYYTASESAPAPTSETAAEATEPAATPA